ncbi:MAG: ABC transporter permease [Clostridiaceae bacterium]|nr:ABC transporter permease [Clostridiaceae bacterium]
MVRNRLLTKFLRDILLAKGQILSIVILSALGVMVFSGLDASWRDLDASVEQYFVEQKLADFWIITAASDKNMERRIARIKGVKDVQSRFSYEMETTLAGDPKLMLHAVRDDIRINIPRIVRGSRLLGNDYKGCLLDVRFADANGLSPGDDITLKIGDRRSTFTVRGLVISPEYVFTSKDIIPEPKSFGFIYTNIREFSSMPRNEICVLLTDDADAAKVKAAIEDELPRAFVRDRKSHNSTQMIRNEVSQFSSLSVLFPIMFFMVSALIVLTTMTRIVENQRTQMGLLKALGYGSGSIMRHYLSFGLFPSMLGSVGGLVAGKFTLPQFLLNVMADMYALPEIKTAPISYAAFSVCVLSVAMTCIICYISCRRNISENAASLLRPKAPKAGSRILFERITVLWSALGFSTKMIMRNLFRSKVRAFMALAGVLSCTALIITAFSLMDTMDHLIDSYYGKTLLYDYRAELDESGGSIGKYRRRMDAERVEGIMEKVVNIRKADGGGAAGKYDDGRVTGKYGGGRVMGEYGEDIEQESRTVLLTVFEDRQELIFLGAQDNGIAGNTAIVSQKLAEVMGLDIGDTLKLKLPGVEKEEKVMIAGLSQIQIGQGLYMTESAWEDLERGAFKPTALLVKNPGRGCIDYLEGLDEVTGIKSVPSLKEKTSAGVEPFSSVAFLMAAFALSLAFVVLYNMGVLNFIERIREFATLKVLGFYQREIRSLIVRENVIVTLAGILAGVYPGIWLAGMVMAASEPDDMVFVSVVDPVSIIAACGITFAFSLLIQRLLAGKVRSIVMVEALKSVE